MNLPVLRILDANFNRAREALRVVEDYARFVLDDDALCGALKQLRHDLATATSRWIDTALLTRDTPGDVGTATKTQTEFRREDTAAVVVAAGKRLGEALRTIEEYLKTVSPQDAAAVESVRYRFYDLEKCKDEFANFSAVYFSNSDYRQVPDTLSNVNLFKAVLNTYFDQHIVFDKNQQFFLQYFQ